MLAMNALSISAPAKINLDLRVGPRDESGFHPLASWMCTVALFDNLSIARDGRAGLHFSCDDPALPRDSGNLVVRAASRMIELANDPSIGLSIGLQKQIPSAAGLGGGSSDAAATIAGLNRLLDLRLSRRQAADIASTLGSDVSFFFSQPSAYCTGRGERVSPLPPPTSAGWALLVFPPFGLSTADVYRRFDAMALGRREALEAFAEAQKLPGLSCSDLLARLVNDLEAPAFSLAPQLGETREAIERHLQRPVRMSGSGSTLFTLFDEQDEAARATRKTRDRFASFRFSTVQLAPKLSDAYNLVEIG
jgi:4-diphosphocytidyl-2-C-methyl-D-erythritol kinase